MQLAFVCVFLGSKHFHHFGSKSGHEKRSDVGTAVAVKPPNIYFKEISLNKIAGGNPKAVKARQAATQVRIIGVLK